MTCREQILEVVQGLKDNRPDGTFSVHDVLTEMHARGSVCSDRTIRSQVISKMCVNASNYHDKRYSDLERVAKNLYRLI